METTTDMPRTVINIIIASLILGGCKEYNDTALQAQYQIINSLSQNDVPLTAPQSGSWREKYNEPEQSFEKYQSSSPVKPFGSRKVIYIKPYGSFSTADSTVLYRAAEYLSIFFQLPAMVLPATSDAIMPNNARRIAKDGHEQLLAPYFLHTELMQHIPADAIVLIAVTAKDLCPKDDWNFVFGQASYHDRVAVCSLFRLHNNSRDTAIDKLCLVRLIKIASHETGHMFGLSHCTTNWCVMDGSNSLEETDLQPARLCSQCLKKLYWNLRFDNKARLFALQDFFNKYGLKQGYTAAKEDWDVISK